MRKVIVTLFFLLLLFPTPLLASDNIETVSGQDEGIILLTGSEKQAEQVTYSPAVQNSIATLSDLKSLIYENFDNYEQSFSIHYTGPTSNLKAEINAILKDIFQSDEYFYRTLSRWAFSYDGYVNNVTITFTMEYLTNKQQEQIVDSEVTRILSEIISPHMNNSEKVKAINDYIVLNTAYSYDTVSSPHSAYAILAEGKGVCQAYALLAFKMLDKLGFEVHYVSGVAGNESHGWNLVKVDGKWYHLDTTWNDPLPDRKAQVRYQYFLVPDQKLEKDHQWEKENFPKALSDDYAYMHDANSATTAGSIIYFSNKADGDKLYKLDFNTKLKTKLSDSRSLFITVFEDYVYFSNYSNGARLTKIHIDGTNQTELNKTASTQLYIEYPYLYFENKDGSLEKMKLSDSISFDPTTYQMWDQKETNNRKKEWNIRLSLPIQAAQVNNQTIYIVDSTGNRLSFITPIIENEQMVRLQNNGQFLENKQYYVVIEPNLSSKSGKKLEKGVVMPFVVK